MPDVQHLVAFWNVENLFGPEDHPHRIDWVRAQVAADLAGWTAELYHRKLAQLARIIGQMRGGAGPDILGLCEVEDAHVLRDLVGALSTVLPDRDYRVVHASNDLSSRGIDTAFLYDGARFSVDPCLVFNHFVMRRTGTRDILQATFRRHDSDRELVVLANHWPSRLGRGGPAASAGFRATAAETLAYWHERIREAAPRRQRTPILALGDLNDDPWDPSVTVNACATRERGDVERGTSARFYNLTWEYLTTRAISRSGRARVIEGSLYFEDNGNLFDQILANRPLLDRPANSGFKVVDGTAGLILFPEMVSDKPTEGPIRFGLPEGNAASKVNRDGYSDHFPVGVTLRET